MADSASRYLLSHPSFNGSARCFLPGNPAPATNLLLAALPKADYQRLALHFEAVMLLPGQVLFEAGDSISHIYLPDSDLVSLLLTSPEGTRGEMDTIGREGMVGTFSALNNNAMVSRAVVKIAGTACLVPATARLRVLRGH